MKSVCMFVMGLLAISGSLLAQVSINNDGSAPDSSAMLDVKSTTKGFLVPRMSHNQIEAIENPADGLQVYCTTDSKVYIYLANAGHWKEMAYGSGIISPPNPCGVAITVDHVAGPIAPVTKTVTYGTVTGVPGEPTKCWITSNLGADHQASAVNDATEASAGWYWQFNRMQGYKHDGSTLTPSWTITDINENSNWLAINDPCSIELGGNWRIPTYSEFVNIDAAGGWVSWYGPWNSVLKMHAAGFLENNGLLYERGIGGRYWNSTAPYPSDVLLLRFNSLICNMNDYMKASGNSIRCIRD